MLYKNQLNKIHSGDCNEILQTLPDNSVDLVLTSPPYFQQRDYGGGGIGNEKTIEEFVANLMKIFKECVRITKPTGTIVFNLGDKYIDGNLT
jgi:site-specific DNA-methyltransferase (adenine-specific)